MPIDPSISLGVKPPQFESPLNALAQVLQIQQAQNQNALSQYTLAKAQRDDADQQAIRSSLSDPNADPYKVLLQRGQVNQAAAYQKSQLENQKAQSDLIDSKLKQSRQMLDSVTTPDQYLQWHQANLTDPVLGPILKAQGVTPQAIQTNVQQALQAPGGFQQLLQRSALGLAKFTELNKPTTNVVNAGGTENIYQTPGLGGAPQLVQSVQKTQSPDNRATIAKDYRVAGLNPDGTDPNGTVGGLSQAAIDNAAKRYNTDGTLPPNMGRGNQGAVETKRILTRAAELANVSPDDASGGRASQLSNKADASALSQLTKQQQLASSFERTANANADLALGLSKKIDRTGIPLINAGLQAWRTGTGSPEATQFAAANETFVNEYAKIMSGGLGNGPVTDAARNKAHTLLTTSMTPEQYEGNVRLLQTEMQNRMKGYNDQANEIRGRISGKIAVPSANPTASAVPPDIAAILQKHGGR